MPCEPGVTRSLVAGGGDEVTVVAEHEGGVMDLSGIVGHPITLIGTVISMCAAIVAGIWKAFTNEIIVTGTQHRRVVAENERNRQVLFRSVGLNEVLANTADVAINQRADHGREATDVPAQ